MAGAVRSAAYRKLLAALVEARQDAGVSQAALAARVGKPPSFIAKIELGERRLDMIEFMVLARELNSSVAEIWSRAGGDLPERL